MTDVHAELEALELPPEPASGSSGSPAPDNPAAADPGHTLWVVLALLVCFVVALPLWLIVSAVVALPLDYFAAEALQHTDGLVIVPEFDRALYAAWAVDITVVLWCLVRRVRSRRDPAARPWRPLAWLWGGYLLGIWITTPIDIFGVADIPEEITSFLLLGASQLAGLMIPLVLLVLLARLLALLWRAARSSVRGYRRVVGLSSALGLGAATTMGSVALGVDAGYFEGLSEAVSEAFDEAYSADKYTEDVFDYYVSASGDFASRDERSTFGVASAFAPAADRTPTDPFAKCAHTLL